MTMRRQRAHERRVLRAIEEHHGLAYRVAYRVLGRPGDAEDAVQDVFLTLIERPEVARRVRRLRSWLVRATLNRARSIVRERERRTRREEAWAVQYTGRQSGRNGFSPEAAAVRDALDTLPEELRLPLVLRYEEGLKNREIAEVLNCPRGTVADRLATGRARLRRRLGPAAGALSGSALGRLLDASHGVPGRPGLAERLRDRVLEQAAGLPPAAFAASAGSAASTASLSALAVAGAASLAVTATVATVLLGGPAEDGSPDRAVSTVAEGRATATGASDGDHPPPPGGNDRATARGAGAARAEGEAASCVPAATIPPEAPATPPARGFTGFVRDASGEAIAGARVVYRGTLLEELGSATSRADGSYALEVDEAPRDPPAPAEVSTQPMSFSGFGDPIRFSEEDLRQSPAAPSRRAVAVRGARAGPGEAARSPDDADSGSSAAAPQVFSTGDDRPVGASSMRREAEQPMLPVEPLERLLGGSPEGLLEAVAPGYVAVREGLPFPTEEEPVREVDFVLARADALVGRVVLPSGDPAEDATVRVAGWLRDEQLPPDTVRTETDAEGRFRFVSLPRGTYALTAELEGSVRVEAVARTGEPVEIVLERAAGLRVRLKRTQGALACTEVRLVRNGRAVRKASAGPFGKTTFDGLLPGEYQVQALGAHSSKPAAPEMPVREETVVLAAGETLEHEVPIPAPVTVTGRVLPAGRGSESAAGVRLHPLDRTWVPADALPTATPDASGAYRIEDVPPGRYLLEADSPRYATREVILPSSDAPVRIDLAASAGSGGRLEVEVAGHGGEALPDASVSFYHAATGTPARAVRRRGGEPSPGTPGPAGREGRPRETGESAPHGSTGAAGSGGEPGDAARGVQRFRAAAGTFDIEIEAGGHEPRWIDSVTVPAGGTHRLRVTLDPRRPLPPSVGEEPRVRLRAPCTLRTVLDLLADALAGGATYAGGVEDGDDLDAIRIGPLHTSIRDLVRRIEGHGLRVRGASGGLEVLPRAR